MGRLKAAVSAEHRDAQAGEPDAGEPEDRDEEIERG
jgi:hypothetical protein